MEVANLPDIFQPKMNYLFHGFKFIRVYIQNLSILTKRYWAYNVQTLELTYNKLKGKGIKYNIKDSLFGQTEIEYLGFWVTCDGVKPINSNIEAVTHMKPPTS